MVLLRAQVLGLRLRREGRCRGRGGGGGGPAPSPERSCPLPARPAAALGPRRFG